MSITQNRQQYRSSPLQVNLITGNSYFLYLTYFHDHCFSGFKCCTYRLSCRYEPLHWIRWHLTWAECTGPTTQSWARQRCFVPWKTCNNWLDVLLSCTLGLCKSLNWNAHFTSNFQLTVVFFIFFWTRLVMRWMSLFCIATAFSLL